LTVTNNLSGSDKLFQVSSSGEFSSLAPGQPINTAITPRTSSVQDLDREISRNRVNSSDTGGFTGFRRETFF
jgi:hypothetical protein